jgi:hypothetical protein
LGAQGVHNSLRHTGPITFDAAMEFGPQIGEQLVLRADDIVLCRESRVASLLLSLESPDPLGLLAEGGGRLRLPRRRRRRSG